MAGMEGKARATNEPNVVPMIDALVLLIIFMLTIPLARVAIDLQPRSEAA
jgi:biopolymer transport protein ExbD